MLKPVWSVLFSLWLCLMCLSLAWGATPAESGPAPESGQIENLNLQLEELRQENAHIQASNNEFFSLLQQAPDMVDSMRHQISLLERQGDPAHLPPKSADAVENTISLLEGQARAMQIGLNDVMDKISVQQALPTDARDQVTNAQKQIKDLQDQLRSNVSASQSNPVFNLKNQVLHQQMDNAILRRDVAQSRLEGYQKLLELYTVNRDLLLLQMGAIKSTLEVLRNQRDVLRQESVAAQRKEAEQLHAGIDSRHALVLAELEKNQALAKELYTLTDSLTRANDQLTDAKQELQDIRYRFEIAEQQLQLTQFDQMVDDYLVRQRQTLRVGIVEQKAADKFTSVISQSRLDQFKFDDQLRQVRAEVSRQSVIDKLLRKSEPLDPERSEEVRRNLQEILQSRADLLSKLVEANAKFVVVQTSLQLVDADQLQERQHFFEMLTQKLFWRRSAAPLDLQWLEQLPGSVIWFVTHKGWGETVDAWLNGILSSVYPMLLFLLVAGLLYWPRRRFIRRLGVLKEHIGNVMRDKFRYTAEALLISVLLAAPLPALMAILAYPLMFYQDASLFVTGVGRSMVGVLVWVFIMELVRVVCRDNGLASAHFSWRPSAINALKRWMPVLYWQLPWAMVFNLVWFVGNEKHAALLGRAAYLTMAVLFWVFTWRLVNPLTGVSQREEGHDIHWYQRWNKPLFWLAVAVPTALVILAFEGFNFTAMTVHVLLLQTMMLAFCIIVLDQVFMRWFAVQERKIALERALAKREAMRKAKENQEAAKSSGDSVPEVDIPYIDVATISEQNRALLRVISYTAFFAVVWWIWQDTFYAANMYGNLVLWSYSLDAGDGAQQIPVTLSTFVFTVIAILLTYVSVKNLPGLIEVVVLQRFSMDSGVRFAVTTTARYLAMIGGVMLVSRMIGLDWSKLGWLVAALGVGLGFGLQEIFANFISGLIILYERPIRIGDTVTINDLSGTVSRIRMRATTITDWDQKELIIPNKTFVTSQFINWTLSDSTTRMVIRVGVAYGSDTDLVTSTLLKIARANEKVLKDPAPTAFFMGFGDSALNFELRVFISMFNQRLVLLHELNSEIDKCFKQLQIEIAFPQLDLHVRDVPVPLQQQAGPQGNSQ